MARGLLETAVLFAAPFFLFALYLAARLRWPLATEHWTTGRLGWLSLAGLAAATLGLVSVNLSAPRGHGVYVPAHIENGRLIPGRSE